MLGTNNKSTKVRFGFENADSIFATSSYKLFPLNFILEHMEEEKEFIHLLANRTLPVSTVQRPPDGSITHQPPDSSSKELTLPKTTAVIAKLPEEQKKHRFLLHYLQNTSNKNQPANEERMRTLLADFYASEVLPILTDSMFFYQTDIDGPAAKIQEILNHPSFRHILLTGEENKEGNDTKRNPIAALSFFQPTRVCL